jgi:hypothetical protein
MAEPIDIKRTGDPGIVIRLRNSMVYYIPLEDILKNYALPPALQAGGKTAEAGAEPAETGNGLQEILSSDGLLQKTNLMNAQFCDKGLLTLSADGKITVSAAKGFKPVHRLF